MQLSPYPPPQSFRPSNPYQQLKYLYQTENHEYFFELIDELKNILKENRILKNNIFEELNYLQLNISSRSEKEKLIADLRLRESKQSNQIGFFKYKYNLTNVEDQLSTIRQQGGFREAELLNKYLRKLLDDKIEYNKQLFALIGEYQLNITMIIKNLYKLFCDPSDDDIMGKLEVLQKLRWQVIQEFNHKILKLTKLSQLNEAVLS